jgi:predicted aspartyl protease
MTTRFILLLLCSCGQVFAQNVDFDRGFIKQKRYFEEIACELVNGKIIVPVGINGKIYKFLLDTGAPNVISKRLFDKLTLEEVNSVAISDANNLMQSMQSTELPILNIGALVFENQPALIYDFDSNSLFGCFKIDGIIGSNLLRKSVLKISTSEQKIYITNTVKDLNPKTKPSKIKLIGSQKSPYVKFSFVGKNTNNANDTVLIDTGMDGFYDMSNRAFNYFIESAIFETVAEAEGVSGIGIFGAGKPAPQRLIKAETATLNNTSIKNLIIETTDDINSRIGLEFLKHGDLIIDFKRKKAYFESKDTIVLESNMPKYTPTIIENKFVVGMVWDENLAKQMSHGDQIIGINSIKTSEMNPCEILNLREQFKNHSSYTIHIKNKENAILSILIEN